MNSSGGDSWCVEGVTESVDGSLCEVYDVFRTCDRMSWGLGD